MKRLFLTAWCFQMLLNGSIAQSPADPNEGATLTSNGNGFYTFSWWVRTENLYYLKWSVDLTNWHYFPYVLLGDLGNDGAHYFESLTIGPGATFRQSGGVMESYQFQIQSPQVFVRAEIQPITVPKDSDADGVPDFLEILNSLNPQSKTDNDGDGLSDDWERLWFGNLTSHNGTTNGDGDTFTDAEEHFLGLNPNAADNASLATMTYDSIGRLKTKGALNFGYDAEGNILNANP